MSTGVELVPIALAIGAVVAARRRDRGSLRMQAERVEVQTLTSRMRDPALLRAAVEDAGGQVFGERDGTMYGALGKVALVFSPAAGGVFDLHVDAALPAAEAQAVVAAVDRGYGVQVQRSTYRRVSARAAEHGFSLESEYVDDDDSIVLSLRVVR